VILYKYVNLEVGINYIITDKTLKFTKPANFNDPFETAALDYSSDSITDLHRFERELSVKDSYGILCLTRNPSNLLMWSHYATGERCRSERGIHLDADSTAHGGLVIGIDANIAGLNNEDDMVIPAKFGSIIYTATKPRNEYYQSKNEYLLAGEINNYRPDLTEALQRVFLYKSQEWAYEEEVRAVKNIALEQSGTITIPQESIVEVYIGSGQNKSVARKSIRDYVLQQAPAAEVYVMKKDRDRWAVIPEKITHANL